VLVRLFQVFRHVISSPMIACTHMAAFTAKVKHNVESLLHRVSLFMLIAPQVYCRAITEAGSDHDSPEPAKNVIELLAPFLAPQQEDTVDDPSGQDSSSGLAAGASPVVSSPPSAEAEEQEVWQFVNQQERNSGLHAVAAALLTRLILGNRAAAVLPQVSQEILDLESCVRGKLSMLYHAHTISFCILASN